MELEFHQVDAFAENPFEGNPAAVFHLNDWLADETLQAIAMEHNLSETTFFVREADGYRIRWFTPVAEVALCGHATLAAACVAFQTVETNRERIRFNSQSGPLSVRKNGETLTLDFPAVPLKTMETPQPLIDALGVIPTSTLFCEDIFSVLEDEASVAALAPDMTGLAKLNYRGIIVTAPGDHVDFVSRFFAPRYGINEDPVTGSAHCALTPYWAERLGKNKLSARQLSRRGGTLECELVGDRVEISGKAIIYAKGTAFI